MLKYIYNYRAILSEYIDTLQSHIQFMYLNKTSVCSCIMDHNIYCELNCVVYLIYRARMSKYSDCQFDAIDHIIVPKN